MKSKSIFCPMNLLAENQTLGNDADAHILPFLVHLEEIRIGKGNQSNYDVCCVFLQAMLSTAAISKNKHLKNIIMDACSAWVDADKRRLKLNTDRMILSGDHMKAISKAVCVFLIAMPQVKVGVWVSAVMHGKKVLEKSFLSEASV